MWKKKWIKLFSPFHISVQNEVKKLSDFCRFLSSIENETFSTVLISVKRWDVFTFFFGLFEQKHMRKEVFQTYICGKQKRLDFSSFYYICVNRCVFFALFFYMYEKKNKICLFHPFSLSVWKEKYEVLSTFSYICGQRKTGWDFFTLLLYKKRMRLFFPFPISV